MSLRLIVCVMLLSFSSLSCGVQDRGVYTFETIMVSMSDGTHLSTDVYIPKGGKKYPVVLVRTPYEKSNPLGKMIGEFFANYGVAVVAQDCRGRGESEGEFYAFMNDRSDGLDCVKWLRLQSWCNGKIGGNLGSYNSYTQLAIADELDVVLQIVSSANMYDLVYPGGLYSLETVHNWAFNIDSQHSNNISPSIIKQSYTTLPLENATMESYGKKGKFVDDWLRHEDYDDYWAKQNFRGKSNAVTLSIAGWYDIFLMGQIADFEAMPQRLKAKSRLVIGPWAHGTHEIENDFGGKCSTGSHEELSTKFLLWALTGKDTAELFCAPFKDARYNLFIMERNKYYASDVWPPSEVEATRHYLTKQGGLSRVVPKDSGREKYVYDPSDPYPSKGGTVLGNPAGQADQRGNSSRKDQVVFNLPIEKKPLVLLGEIDAELFVETDAVSTDFIVCIQDVFPDGKIVNIQEGGAEYIPGQNRIERLKISIWASGYQFNTGHTLRVVVTSSWFPRFNRNLNMGEPIHTAKKMRKANQSIYFGNKYPSAIILPILDSDF